MNKLTASLGLGFVLFCVPMAHAEQPFADGPPGAAAPLAATPGHPLLRADPNVWLPVLAQTQDPVEAVEAAKKSLGQSVHIHALGDANGDGAGDHLVAQEIYDNEGAVNNTVLTARAGGTNARLWTLALSETSYWYPLGDATGDGVKDLVVHDWGEQSFESGLTSYSMSARGTYVFVDGASGAQLIERPALFELEVTMAGGGVAAYVVVEEYRMRITALDRLGDGTWSGVDYVDAELRMRDAWAFAGLAYAVILFDGAETIRLERLHPSGAEMWSWEMDLKSGATSLHAEDYTGDSVPDVLVSYRESRTPEAQAYSLIEAGFPSVDVPHVVLVDGATGLVAWSFRGEEHAGFSMAVSAGMMRAEQRDVFLITFGREMNDQFTSIGSRVTVLDGKQGSVLRSDRWNDEFVFPVEFADVDGDGAGELLLFQAPAEDFPYGISLSVVRASFEPIWSMSPEDVAKVGGTGALVPDFNGDAVPDFPLLEWNETTSGPPHLSELRILSGRDGNEVWTARLDHRIHAVNALEDATGDGGVDLALTSFDRPDPAKAGEEGEPAKEPGNLTDFPGFLELRRGSDFASIWKRQIVDPEAGIRASDVWVGVERGEDANGNGRPELLYSLDSPLCDTQIEYYDGYAIARPCEPTNESVKNHINFALVLDGGDGGLLAVFPDSPAGFRSPSRAAPLELTEDSPSTPMPSARGWAPGPPAALLVVTLALIARWWVRPRTRP